MSDARTEILARIAAIPRAPEAAPERTYRGTGGLTPEAVVHLFCERVADYRAEVRRCSPGSVVDEIAGVAAAHGAARIGIPAGLRADWRPTGFELLPDTSLDIGGLDSLDGALTGCTVAIAETGTIVLAAGRETGIRALTLVPDLHICVVEAAQVVELVPEGLRRAGALVREERRPITLVSGPSATSDIELRRVEGVHGPRRLVVLVVEAWEAQAATSST